MDSMLQKFLDAEMLDIDNDDVQYNYLLETAEELAAALTENVSDVIPFTLVALDPDCAPSDPVFDRIEETLKSRWRLLRKRFTDRPRQIYRAIAFEALNVAGDRREDIFPLVWLTGRSYLPYARLNNEVEICREFFSELGTLFDTTFSDSARSTKLLELRIRQAIPTQNLEEQWAAAISGAYPYKGTNLSTAYNPNPRGTRGDYFPEQLWIDEFAPRAARLLTEFYNNQLDRLSKDIEEFIGTHTINMQTAMNLKSNILWWKQTLYSPSQHKSYREIEPVLAAMVMALDLHKQTPPIYPISTDYLLHETVLELLSWHNRPSNYGISLENYLEAVDTENNREIFQSLLSKGEMHTGRNSLLALTQAHLYGRPVAKESVRQRLGIASDVEIPLSHIAVWLFRDLQAQTLIQGA